jgi:hypothetical protein
MDVPQAVEAMKNIGEASLCFMARPKPGHDGDGGNAGATEFRD